MIFQLGRELVPTGVDAERVALVGIDVEAGTDGVGVDAVFYPPATAHRVRFQFEEALRVAAVDALSGSGEGACAVRQVVGGDVGQAFGKIQTEYAGRYAPGVAVGTEARAPSGESVRRGVGHVASVLVKGIIEAERVRAFGGRDVGYRCVGIAAQGFGRQCPAPDIQLLIGHDLSGEDHGLEVRQRHGIQCAGIGHAAHDRGHPEDAADLLLGHVFHQLHRVHKEDFRDNQHLCPPQHPGIEVKDRIVKMEKTLKDNAGDVNVLKEAKVMGFSDAEIALLWDKKETDIYAMRKENGIVPVFRMVDTCHTNAYIPYFYSSYTGKNESRLSDKKKVVVLGAGPIRIGQGVEFDYSTVHAVQTIRREGYEAIIINNNPETVSTDYTTADKLYFEPLTPEDVMNVIDYEQPIGVIATLGGQTAINLAEPLRERGVKIIGTDCDAIEKAENRDAFEKLLVELGIPQPQGRAVTHIEDGVKAAEEIGYPVLVRPSFVLGGRAMQIVANEEQLRHYLRTAVEIDEDKPVLVDHYIMGKEVEVDAICDGRDVFVPGIMELVERTGIHSGDSISVYPSFSISNKVKGTILQYAKKLGTGIGIVGLYNIQFIVDEHDDVYIIEVNPRSSRTVPFLSKSTGYSLADIATEVILGKSLKEQGIFDLYPEEKSRYYVKVPVFSFNKIRGLDAYLSPEMKSTGEAIGYDDVLYRALYKALQASGMKLLNYGTVFATIADHDKEEALPLIRRFYDLGFNIEATRGTAEFLKKNGIRTRAFGKISEGSTEILDEIRKGYVTYIINTRDLSDDSTATDGHEIRQVAVENNAALMTSLDTVKALLDVLEETTMKISTIDA